MVNHVQTIESVQFLDCSKNCLGASLLSESFGPSEGSVGPDLSLEVGVASLLDSSSGGFSLADIIEWLGTLLPTICVYVKPER